MTTISIPPDVERPLIEAALRLGTTPERLAVAALRERFGAVLEKLSTDGDTLTEFLAGFVGTIEGSSEAYSVQGHR